MARAKALAGQSGREQNNQQRPQISDEARVGRRRVAQRGEIERMIAEEPADPDNPDAPWLGQPRQAPSRRSVDQAAETTDGECQGGQFERRRIARQRGQERQGRPQEDRAKADDGGGNGGSRRSD
jgi:hypothetical protein